MKFLIFTFLTALLATHFHEHVLSHFKMTPEECKQKFCAKELEKAAQDPDYSTFVDCTMQAIQNQNFVQVFQCFYAFGSDASSKLDICAERHGCMPHRMPVPGPELPQQIKVKKSFDFEKFMKHRYHYPIYGSTPVAILECQKHEMQLLAQGEKMSFINATYSVTAFDRLRNMPMLYHYDHEQVLFDLRYDLIGNDNLHERFWVLDTAEDQKYVLWYYYGIGFDTTYQGLIILSHIPNLKMTSEVEEKFKETILAHQIPGLDWTMFHSEYPKERCL